MEGQKHKSLPTALYILKVICSEDNMHEPNTKSLNNIQGKTKSPVRSSRRNRQLHNYRESETQIAVLGPLRRQKLLE